jgi:hypothetical protein
MKESVLETLLNWFQDFEEKRDFQVELELMAHLEKKVKMVTEDPKVKICLCFNTKYSTFSIFTHTVSFRDLDLR